MYSAECVIIYVDIAVPIPLSNCKIHYLFLCYPIMPKVYSGWYNNGLKATEIEF